MPEIEKPIVELYKQDRAYAREHDEINDWRHSMQENRRCAVALDKALAADSLTDMEKVIDDIAAVYGAERTKHVLAAHVYNHRFDSTFSFDVKEWAKQEMKGFSDAFIKDSSAYSLNASADSIYRIADKAIDVLLEIGGEKDEPSVSEKAQTEIRIVPFCKYSAAQARKYDDLEQWRASNKENQRCISVIDDTTRKEFDGFHLDTDRIIKDAVTEFGMERVAFVLASHVADHDWDGRFRSDVKEWANKVMSGYSQEVAEYGKNNNHFSSHSILVDGLASAYMKLEREIEKELYSEQTPETPEIPDEPAKQTNKEKVKAITQKLEQGVKDVFSSDRYKDYLKVMGKFHNYSMKNTMDSCAEMITHRGHCLEDMANQDCAGTESFSPRLSEHGAAQWCSHIPTVLVKELVRSCAEAHYPSRPAKVCENADYPQYSPRQEFSSGQIFADPRRG